MDLTKVARPWSVTDGDIPTAWAQQEYYGKPVIASRIEELIGRISLFSTNGANVLRLWDPTHETLSIPQLLESLQLPGDNYAVALSPASRTPIECGYLELIHLTPAAHGVEADAALTEFVRSQQMRYPDMERHLVDCYGTLSAERSADPRFRSIDYRGFDLGSVQLGLGLFAEHVRYRHSSIWCWSRVVNWHK